MPNIDYSKIPYDEQRSTGERVGKNAFYLVNDDCKLTSDRYFAHDFSDLSLDDAPYIPGGTIQIPTVTEEPPKKYIKK